MLGNSFLDHAHVLTRIMEHMFHCLQGTRKPKKPGVRKCKGLNMKKAWQSLNIVRTGRNESYEIEEADFTLDDIQPADTVLSFSDTQSTQFKNAVKMLSAALERSELDMLKDLEYKQIQEQWKEVKEAHGMITLTKAELSNVIERKQSIFGPQYFNDHSRRPFYDVAERGHICLDISNILS